MMKRHFRDNYFIVGEGIVTYDGKHRAVCERPSTEAEARKFHFSRMGPRGEAPNEALRLALANAMTAESSTPDDPRMPAGFTYLGQFIDHDLTFDRTQAALGENVSVRDLIQGRSPALDLDCLYGRGPENDEDQRFYSDGIRLKTGTTAATPFPDSVANRDLEGFDLPRSGVGSTKSDRRKAVIPDLRNDENLAVAQTHLAFIHFHNRMVEKLARKGIPSALLFNAARRRVVRHYQWMVVTDLLPRIVEKNVLEDVFKNGRKVFEVIPAPGDDCESLFYLRGSEGGDPGRAHMWVRPGDMPTMPIEFSVAAYRLGHSMIRDTYQWNRVFRDGGPGPSGSLALLFNFSGTSGTLSPPPPPPAPPPDPDDPEQGDFERLPTNWAADFRRLFDFSEAGRDDLTVADAEFNFTKRIDTLLVDPLKQLPLGSFGPRDLADRPPQDHRNLAFRNLTRAQMVSLASGQQMAELMAACGVKVTPLTEEQIINGDGGADLSALDAEQKSELSRNTPLWFYILREAELNGGRLTGVGGRIVAEVFHRAIEGSQISILRHPWWRPSLGPDSNTFRMVDLLLFAFEGNADLLNPMGDAAPEAAAV
jgi:hypothetical protein